MLKRKVYSESGRFKPYPFVVKKDRRRSIVVESAPIDWSSLSEDEFRTQWSYCMNSLWFSDKEDIISKDGLKPYVSNFMKSRGYSEEQIKKHDSVPEWMNSMTVCSAAYLIMSGINNPESERWLRKKIDENLLTVKPEVKQEEIIEKPKRSIQDAMKDKLSEVLGELHGMEDDADFKSKPDFIKWFTSQNIAKSHMDNIEAKFKPVLEELETAQSGIDEQVKEAYSSYSKSDIKKRIEWYKHLLTDVDAYRRLKMTNRKVRVRKPKSPTKLVSRLKYLAYSEEHTLQSVNPEKIIGANTLWVYHQKYKRLIMYVASDMEKELSVKGSTIVGWDPKSSYGKTLRKPEEQLKALVSSGKVSMRNFLKDIKGKDKTVNGRINKDCLLFKIF